ncbi:aminomethyltransferase family protein [Ruegeria sp. Ofav3-42]|uniref:aminomethyltransferase family protein n=1 Tax=Ruegeria sp. Ofav3-42 TaxID=2917759 RepID=UPI001EF6BC39|nr:aminomethyltransferase family protein [Ruegeria sp. Ofav3-42]MCG7522541.1 aminomethyltransferase family protein [Ruegeria sp. Ofav3-42]
MDGNDIQNVKFETGLNRTESGRPAFFGSPFVEATAPLNGNALWMRWGEYMVVDTYSNMADEVKAIRERVAMGDMSPLSKYRISGSDAEDFLDGLIPRPIAKLQDEQIYYSPWCTEEGNVIGDGLIIREDANNFLISADPGLKWWTSNIRSRDVNVSDETDNFGILTLQGPKSRETVAAAADGEFSELPFSRLGWVTIAGQKIRIIRQGFTGEHGYELWVPRAHGVAVWEAVAKAGAQFDILPAGAWALDIARIEAGLLIVGYDYTSAGPDGGAAGVYAAGTLRASPLDLGLGRLIDYDGGDFVGKAALSAKTESGDHRQLVGLEIDWKGFESDAPGNLTRVRWYPASLTADGRDAGFATSVTWSPTTRRLIGFGHVAKEFAEPGTQLQAALSENDADTVTATVIKLPFYKLNRSC